LLLATGRRPAVDGLGLEHVGLTVSHERLSHDASMRTAHPRIYVAGDTTGSYQILHLANEEGRIAGHNAAGGDPPQAIDYRLRMSVTFTDPPMAQIGLSTPEVEAQRKQGREIVEAAARFPETGRAITMGVEHGLWKLFVDAADCRPVGSVILGPRAADLIHLVSMMMYYGGRFDDVARLPWYHPTLSEVMINLQRDLAGRLSGCERAVPPPA
jgi:pyruvate/2-oxoglutarate dehydrogenase complex dihydrolipoamide dehydrogenase (E3) component